MAGAAHNLAALVRLELGARLSTGVYIARLSTLRMIPTELWPDLIAETRSLAASAAGELLTPARLIGSQFFEPWRDTWFNGGSRACEPLRRMTLDDRRSALRMGPRFRPAGCVMGRSGPFSFLRERSGRGAIYLGAIAWIARIWSPRCLAAERAVLVEGVSRRRCVVAAASLILEHNVLLQRAMTHQISAMTRRALRLGPVLFLAGAT